MISATTIQRTYREGGVRYKFIKRAKKEIDFSNEYYRELFDSMYKGIKDAETSGTRLIYIDEAVFSFNTFSTKAWSSANK